ncbi:MAG: UDP-N-acetylglucosamine 2-epimerase [Acidobacteriota bacterium]|nr:UDP-N-acetylglucosamine 2-epimerase [Acidobacteriota bacterium]
MAIVFVAGTTAEFIKIGPVLAELTRRGLPYRVWSTAQHVDGVAQTLKDLDVRQPDRQLVSGGRRSVARVSQVPAWLANVVWATSGQFRALKKEVGRNGIVLVHGDTFTTVIGAALGRLLGAEVAHIEAGLRSGSIRSPFPEELNRRIVGRLATLHFAPTERERENLADRVRKGKAEVIVTGANTVVDALRHAQDADVEVPELPDTFGLITLHRFELVQSKSDFEAILLRLREFSKKLPLVMVVGNSERARIEEYGLEYVFDDRMTRIDKRAYSAFLAILMKASMVVTDSGGLQEECAALGVPCAVHRERTERHQGLGENVVLTELKLDRLDQFLDNWQEYRRPSTVDKYHPSVLIVDRIARYAASPGDRQASDR